MNLVELQGSTRAENETRGRALISSEKLLSRGNKLTF